MTARPRMGRPTRAQAAELDDRLRRAAVDTFLASGFDGTTMEAIAAAAGISKRTLYAKYPDKRTLFSVVLPWAMASTSWGEVPEPNVEGDLREALLAIGRAAIARAVDPRLVQLRRIAMANAEQFPEFARAAQTMMWSPRIRALVALLEHHASEGTIHVEEPELAAEQFLGMVSGFPAILASFEVRRTPREEERHLHHAVQLFLTGVCAPQ